MLLYDSESANMKVGKLAGTDHISHLGPVFPQQINLPLI